MRSARWITVMVVVGAILAVPEVAAANGGAYLELDRTHYVPGEIAVARASVFVPRQKQDLFENGPFYAFVVPKGSSVREGGPIPPGVIRAGTFSVDHVKGQQFDLRASFTVPVVPAEFYSVAVCNDPCTVSGFREPLTGSISIVQTAREGKLLTQQERLKGQIGGLRRDLRKAERQGHKLQSQIEASEQEHLRLSSELSVELADARTKEPPSRPLIGPWAASVIAIALLTLAGTVAIRRRRPASIVVPDTIEEIEREAERSAKR